MTILDISREYDLLTELEPVVASNIDRHLSVARDWHPHDYVPWSEGRNFAFLGGQDWSPEESRLTPVARASMLMNLLTEDNLPGYHRVIATAFGTDGAWRFWLDRWTAEENRHAIVLRDYLTVTRAVDPVDLEQRRMRLMSKGVDDGPQGALENVAYVSFQELATRVTHRNTGRTLGCPIGDQMMARIAADENLHMVFYRNLAAAALDLAPDETMQAIRNVVLNFEMPGGGQPDFMRYAVLMANEGVYDLRLHHDGVIMPVLRFWKVFERTDLSPAGEKAREELATFLSALDAQASRFEERREERRARAAARDGEVGA